MKNDTLHLCKIWLKFWPSGFRKVVNAFSLCYYYRYPSLEKCMTLYLSKLKCPSIEDALCRLFQLERNVYMYRRTDRRSDRQTEEWTTGDQKISQCRMDIKIIHRDPFRRECLCTLQKYPIEVPAVHWS